MNQNLNKIIPALKKATRSFPTLLINQIIIDFGRDPYLILIACLLSLRAKDSVTIHVCRDLFSRVKTPQELLALPIKDLERIIRPLGFYRVKTRILREVSTTLLADFAGKVPDSEEKLLRIKGVGRKTAMLVLSQAFGHDTICVDIHVHRISNRLGLVKTKTPHETERALMAVLPKKYWTVWNTWLVLWGQHVCRPISPWCSKCALRSWCKRVGVTKSR